MTNTCETCRFWQPDITYKPKSLQGECHKRSPRIVTDPGSSPGPWPPTLRIDWCGDHESKPIDTPDDTEEGCVMSAKNTELFMFVWDQFCPDYTGGLAVAIAQTVDEAQKLIEQRQGYEVHEWGPVQQFSVTEPIAFCVSGGA